MNSPPGLILLSLCVALVCCEEKANPDQPVKVEIGKEAPDLGFEVLATDKKAKLSDFKGKVVVAKFWWSKCSMCNDTMDHLQAFIEDHPDWKDEVVFLSVSIDPTIAAAKRHLVAVEKEENRSWSNTLNTWHDSKGGASPMYLAYAAETGVPVSYVIDQTGTVAAIDSPSSATGFDLDKAVRDLLDP